MAKPRPLLVLGGGRWGRVHVRVWREVLPADVPMVWVSKHNRADNQHWLGEQGLAQIEVSEILPALPCAAVVASASVQHAKDVQTLLHWGVPILCEKPLALREDDAQHTLAAAAAAQVPLGVVVEFRLADFVQAFAQLVPLEQRSLRLRWTDMLCETRHEATKVTDIGTPLLWDVLPHVASIIQAVWPTATGWQCAGATWRTGVAEIVLRAADGREVLLECARQAPQRTRRVWTDEGLVLDFTTEPARLEAGAGATPQLVGAVRPMLGLARDFWNRVQRQDFTDWPYAAAAQAPWWRVMADAQAHLQPQWLRGLQQGELAASLEWLSTNLQGRQRVPLTTVADQQAAVALARQLAGA